MVASVLKIARYRTAIRRSSVSLPLARALADGLVTKETAVFDYGCGLGGDIAFLRSRRIAADGWDPYYRPRGRLRPADVVNIGYVLNVIEDPGERAVALREACQLAGKLLIVAVRTDQPLEEGEEFGDGFCTGRGTFQKLYTTQEFREYIKATLALAPLLAAPGIAYVFKNEDLKSWYLANRAFTRRLEYRIDLLETFASDRLARRYVALAGELGRLPLRGEFPAYVRLVDRFGPPGRLERLALRALDRVAYEGSRVERRADIVTYLAMLRLEGLRPPPFQLLPVNIQADVRSLWKNYAAADLDARQLLFTIGNPEAVRAAAAESSVGKLLPEDLYVHRSATDELPALLRLIVFASTRIVGEIGYELVKISLHGRSVSFLQYPMFDNEAHPALLRSVRVYLPRATYAVREYDQSRNPPILHRKDRVVQPDYPLYQTFRRLTAQEEALGLLGVPDIGRRVEWEALLAGRGLVIKDHEVIPA